MKNWINPIIAHKIWLNWTSEISQKTQINWKILYWLNINFGTWPKMVWCDPIQLNSSGQVFDFHFLISVLKIEYYIKFILRIAWKWIVKVKFFTPWYYLVLFQRYKTSIVSEWTRTAPLVSRWSWYGRFLLQRSGKYHALIQ